MQTSTVSPRSDAPADADLTADEQEALRLAHMSNGLTPAEYRELMHFLGWPLAMPARPVSAVWERMIVPRLIEAAWNSGREQTRLEQRVQVS